MSTLCKLNVFPPMLPERMHVKVEHGYGVISRSNDHPSALRAMVSEGMAGPRM